MKKLIVILVLLLTVAINATPQVQRKCPIDDMMMYYTGQNQFINGRCFQLYRCPSGHEILFRCSF